MEFDNYGPIDKLYPSDPIKPEFKIKGWQVIAGVLILGLIGFVIWKNSQRKKNESKT